MSTHERLPVEPVLDLLARTGRSINSLGPSWARAVARAKRDGGITWLSADRLAVEVLHRHPAELWPEEW